MPNALLPSHLLSTSYPPFPFPFALLIHPPNHKIIKNLFFTTFLIYISFKFTNWIYTPRSPTPTPTPKKQKQKLRQEQRKEDEENGDENENESEDMDLDLDLDLEGIDKRVRRLERWGRRGRGREGVREEELDRRVRMREEEFDRRVRMREEEQRRIIEELERLKERVRWL